MRSVFTALFGVGLLLGSAPFAVHGEDTKAANGKSNRAVYKVRFVNETGTEVRVHLVSATWGFNLKIAKEGTVTTDPTVNPVGPGIKIVVVFDTFTEKPIGSKEVEIVGNTLITLRPIEEEMKVAPLKDNQK